MALLWGRPGDRLTKMTLPVALDILNRWLTGKKSDSKFVLYVEKAKIAEDGEYNLTGDRYRETVDYSNVKWPMVELGKVCDILDNLRKPVNKGDRKKGDYPYYGATGILDYVDEYIFDDKLVLVGEDGAKWGAGDNTAFIAKGKYWANNHVHVLCPNRERLLDEFLVPILNNQDLSKYLTGTTIPKLNQANLKSIIIPLPPLEVQEQIVSEIGQYQKIINGATQVVHNWKPYFRVEPEWPTVKLGEVAEVVAGQSPRGEYYNEVGEGIPFYQGKTEFSDVSIRVPRVWTTETTKIAEKGDILMSVRAPVGPVNLSTERVCIGRGLASIRAKRINRMFLFYYLKSIKDDIRGNGGAVFDSISKTKIMRLSVPFPSSEVQEQVVAEIEAEQKAINECKNLIEVMETKIKTKVSEIWGE